SISAFDKCAVVLSMLLSTCVILSLLSARFFVKLFTLSSDFASEPVSVFSRLCNDAVEVIILADALLRLPITLCRLPFVWGSKTVLIFLNTESSDDKVTFNWSATGPTLLLNDANKPPLLLLSKVSPEETYLVLLPNAMDM